MDLVQTLAKTVECELELEELRSELNGKDKLITHEDYEAMNSRKQAMVGFAVNYTHS